LPPPPLLMNYHTYADFDLLFERVSATGDEVYRATLLNSPEGQAQVEFGQNHSPQQWTDIKAQVCPAANQSNLITSTATLTTKQWGQLLFEHVFHGELRQRWIASLIHVKQNETGLRILLRLNDVPELAIFPWEYMYDSGSVGFLAISNETPIVRYLHVSHGTYAAPITEKLRVLVVISQPLDKVDPNVKTVRR